MDDGKCQRDRHCLLVDGHDGDCAGTVEFLRELRAFAKRKLNAVLGRLLPWGLR